MDKAPTTAFSEGSISEDSFAISMVILAAPYAVSQPASHSRAVTPSLDVSWISYCEEPIERAIAVDVAASTLESLRDASWLTRRAGDVGVELTPGDFDLKRRRITRMGVQISSVKLALGSGLPIETPQPDFPPTASDST